MCEHTTAATMMSGLPGQVPADREFRCGTTSPVAFSLRRVRSRPRATDRHAAADHHDVCAGDRHVVPAQQMHDAARVRGRAPSSPIPTDRGWSDAACRRPLSESMRWGRRSRPIDPVQRQLNDVPGAVRVGVESIDGGVQLHAWLMSAGRSRRIEFDADLGAVGVLAAHMAWSLRSWTRMVPSPGVRPVAVNAATRSVGRRDFVPGGSYRPALSVPSGDILAEVTTVNLPQPDVFSPAKARPPTLRSRIIKAATFGRRPRTPWSPTTDRTGACRGRYRHDHHRLRAVSPGGRTDGWQIWMRPEGRPRSAPADRRRARRGRGDQTRRSARRAGRQFAHQQGARSGTGAVLQPAIGAVRAQGHPRRHPGEVTDAHAPTPCPAGHRGQLRRRRDPPGHNYLASFVSCRPLLNRRDDEFGGSLNRASGPARWFARCAEVGD